MQWIVQLENVSNYSMKPHLSNYQSILIFGKNKPQAQDPVVAAAEWEEGGG